MIAIPATAGPLAQLGNYSPDEGNCPRDKLSTVIEAVNAHFLRHFTLTLVTMAQLRRLVRSTLNG